MPLNGSGTYSPPGASFPAVVGTIIESAKFNAVINDIAAALSTAFYRDGQAVASAPFDLGGQQLRNVGLIRNSIGSVGAPSYTFTGDLSTGLYSPTTGQIALTANGVARVLADGTRTRLVAPNGSIRLEATNNGVFPGAESSTVNLSNPTRFGANRSAGAGFQTSGSVIIFDTELFDVDSCYNPTNGRFTAPASGVYVVTASATFNNNGGVATNFVMNFTRNGSITVDAAATITNVAPSGFASTSMAQVMTLNANDFVEVFVGSLSASFRVAGGQYTQFSAVRIA